VINKLVSAVFCCFGVKERLKVLLGEVDNICIQHGGVDEVRQSFHFTLPYSGIEIWMCSACAIASLVSVSPSAHFT
jgi:hypothetical protein